MKDVNEEEARAWRERSLDEVASEATNLTGGRLEKATVELQRRLIMESTKASKRLLVATWVIAFLTVVLIAIAVLQAAGVLD